MGIAKIPDAATIGDLVQQLAAAQGGDVPGVKFIAGTGAAPGEKSNVVFAEPLGPGRYVMICFRPDTTEGPDGPPHALKGMVHEFIVK
jgi:hypothetical protein